MHKFNSKDFIYEVLSELELNYCFCVEISRGGRGAKPDFNPLPSYNLAISASYLHLQY